MDTKQPLHPPTIAPEATPLPTTTPATTPSTTSSEALQDITFGSLAGLVGKIVEYPFDTIKVRLQSQPDHLPLRYIGPLDCFKQSLASDGFRGLYRGVSAPLAGAAAENACLFWSYTLGQNLIRQVVGVPGIRPEDDELPLRALVAAGAFSGGVTSLVLTPIELVKCRMQAPLQPSTAASASASATTTTTLSPLRVITDISRREGLLGFWRGQFGTFLRETGGSAAWFGAWEASTLFFKSRLAATTTISPSSSSSSSTDTPTPIHDIPLPLTQQMASGALAGISYNFLFYPADTIKSKIQTGELSSSASASSASQMHGGAGAGAAGPGPGTGAGGGGRPTFSSVAREVYRVHGLRGLYRGCGITCMRSAPSSALIFTIVANLKEMVE